MARSEIQLLPEFTAELEEIRANGINKELLYKILQKHLPNADYNKILYKRYMTVQEGVPIFSRTERYKDKKNRSGQKQQLSRGRPGRPDHPWCRCDPGSYG